MAESSVEVIVKVKDEASPALAGIVTSIEKISKSLVLPNATFFDTITKQAKEAAAVVADASASLAVSLNNVKSRSFRNIATDAQAAASALRVTKGVVDSTGGSFRNLGGTSLKAAQQEVQRLNKVTAELNKQVVSTRESFSLLGPAARTAAAAFSIGTAIKETVEFDRAITQVVVNSRPAIGTTKELSAEVLKLSAAFGVAPTQTAQDLYKIVTSGAVESANATKTLETSLKLSKLGFGDTSDVAKSLSTVLKAYSLDVEQASDVSDLLFTASAAGGVTFRELSEFIGRTAPIARELNVPLNELVAIFLSLREKGIPALQALVGIRAAFQSLLRQSPELNKVFQSVEGGGFASAEAAVKTIGLVEALKILVRATNGSETALLSLTASTEASAPILALAGDNAGGLGKALGQLEEGMGGVNRSFDDFSKSQAQQFDKAVASLQGAVIGLTSSIAPVINGVFKDLQSLSGLIKSFGTENEDTTQLFSRAVIGLTEAWLAFFAIGLIARLTGVLTVIRAFTGVTSVAGAAVRGIPPVLTQAAAKFGVLKTATLIATEALKGLALFFVTNPIGAGIAAITTAAVLLTQAEIKQAEAEVKLREATDSLTQAILDRGRAGAAAVAVFEKYAAVQTVTQDALNALSQEELESYQARVEGLKSYLLGLRNSQDSLIKQGRDTAAASVEQEAFTRHLKLTGEQADFSIAGINKQLEALAPTIRDVANRFTEISKAAEAARLESNIFTTVLATAITESKDQVAELSTAFKNVNFSNAPQLLQVIQSLGLGVSTISEAFKVALEDQSVESINKLLSQLVVLRDQGAISLKDFAGTATIAIGALFTQLGVNTQAQLATLDQNIVDTFTNIVRVGTLKSNDLVTIVTASLDKLKTAEAATNFGQVLETAFQANQLSAREYEITLNSVRLKQQELAVSSSVLASALKSASEFFNITTVKQASSDFENLKLQFSLVSEAFNKGQVSADNFGIAAQKAAQDTFTFLTQTKGLSDQTAAAIVKTQFAVNGLKVAISSQGEVTVRTARDIIRAQRDAANEITKISVSLEDLNRKVKKAVDDLNSSDLSKLSKDVAAAFNEAAENVDLAFSRMVISQRAFESAVITGNQDLIEISKAQYDADVNAFKSAQDSKKQAAINAVKDIEKAQSDAISTSAQTIQQQGQSAGDALAGLFNNVNAGLSQVSQDTLSRLSSLSSTATRDVQLAMDSVARSFTEGFVRTFGTGVTTVSNEMSLLTNPVEFLKQQLLQLEAAAAQNAATFDEFNARLREAPVLTTALSREATQLTSNLQQVDKQRLDQLKASIDSARQRLNAFRNEAADTLRTLKSELAGLRGDDAQVENIEFGQKREDLEKRIAVAREAGDLKSLQDLRASLGILTTIHNEKLRQIAAEKLAALNAERERDEEAKRRAAEAAAREAERAKKRQADAETLEDTFSGIVFPTTPAGGFDPSRQVKPPAFADGGVVSGPGTGRSDSILARLSAGEFVSDAKTTAFFGPGFFHQLKAMSRGVSPAIPRFAEGGLVGSARTTTPSRNVNISISLDNQSPVVGTFGEDDADKFIKLLEDLGGRAQ